MGVISITIIQSSSQTTPGIPDNITLVTNIPATIFYTLDGTNPDVNAPVYILPIELLQGLPQIILNVFATDGINSSAVISQTYTANLAQIVTSVGDRVPQAQVNSPTTVPQVSQFPFGSNSPNPDFTYGNAGNSFNTVLDQSLPSTPTTFDANGNPAGFVSQSLNPFGTPQSNIGYNGQVDIGGGTKVPVTAIGKESAVEYEPEFSSKADLVFNPKALVIFQDLTNPATERPPIIFRPHFSLENQEIVKDGSQLAIPLDTATYTGTFIRSAYNGNDHTMTYYYWDSKVNRWLINKTPYAATAPNINSLSNIVFGRQQGGDKVFTWRTFQSRTFP